MVDNQAVERIVPGTKDWDNLYEEHKIRYEFASTYCKGKEVLDVACGTGFGSKILLQSGAKQVLGVDISESAINYARHHYIMPSLSYRIWDCQKIDDLNQKFDVVVSFETIEHLPDPEMFVSGISKIISEKGFFILSTPNKECSDGKNPYHISEMYLQEAVNLLKKYFDIIEIDYQAKAASYLRYLNLFDIYIKITTSRAFRIVENFRLLMGRNKIFPVTNTFTAQPLDGDYMISHLSQEDVHPEVYIFICQPGKS